MARNIRAFFKKILIISIIQKILVMCLAGSSLFALSQTFEEGSSLLIDNRTLQQLSENNLKYVHLEYLESSIPIFYRISNSWSVYGYRDRGLKSYENQISFNRIPFQSTETGVPLWRYWGGLNDVFRYPESVSLPFELNGSYHLPKRGLMENYSTFSRDQKKQSRITLSKASSISYKNRIMYTYFSGPKDNGWSWNLSASKRWSELSHKHIYYDGYSYYLSVDRLIKNHHFNGSIFGSPTIRESSTALTKEVYDLFGANYNPKWGWYRGRKKSANLVQYHVPKFNLSHEYKGKNATIFSSLSYHFGKESRQKIIRGSGYYDNNGSLNILSGNSVFGDYYQYLPSYYENEGLNPEYAEVYNVFSDLMPIKYGQINWNYIYNTNSELAKQHKPSVYYLGEDVTQQQEISLQSSLKKSIFNNNGYFNISGLYQNSILKKYTLLTDLLGGNPFIDVNPFYSESRAYNNLKDPYGLKYPGQSIDYNYVLYSSLYEVSNSFSYEASFIDMIFRINTGVSSYQRKGLFQNGRYVSSSLGKSKVISNTFYSFQNRFNLKFSGNHMIKVNISYLVSPPNLERTFFDIRYANILTPDLNNSKKLNANFSYLYRRENLRINLNGYFSEQKDGSDLYRYYIQSLESFIHQSLNNVSTQQIGIEFATEINLKDIIFISYGGVLSQSIYTNNPNSWIISQDDPNPKYIGKSYLKNYKLGYSPQQVHHVEIKIKTPSFFIISLSLIHLRDYYVSVSPFKRTDYFSFEDPENRILYENYSESDTKALLQQETINPPSWFLNFSIYKSWKIKNHRLGISLFVNNLLDKKGYRTGGFEQSRAGTFSLSKSESERKTPLFGNRYWYLNGQSIFLNCSITI